MVVVIRDFQQNSAVLKVTQNTFVLYFCTYLEIKSVILIISEYTA